MILMEMTQQMYSSSLFDLYKTNVDFYISLHMIVDSQIKVIKTMVSISNALLECSLV